MGIFDHIPSVGGDKVSDKKLSDLVTEDAFSHIPAAKASPRETELRAQYGKEIMGRGEPGYGERIVDAQTFGMMRPLSGVVRGVGGLLDPNSTFGERYRAGNAAAEDYFNKGAENTAGVGGIAADVFGSLTAPPVGKLYTGGANLLKAGKAAITGAPAVTQAAQTGGRELLGKIIGQGVTTGGLEGAARNSKDVGSAAEGALVGGVLGGGASAVVGGASKLIPGLGVNSANKAVREANQGLTPGEVKASAKPLLDTLDQNGLAYAQKQNAQLKAGLDDLAATNQYNPIAHAPISDLVNQLDKLATQPQGAKYTELNNIRSALAEQGREGKPSIRAAVGKINAEIDRLVLNNEPAINPNNIADVGGVHEVAKKLWKAGAIADDVGYTAGKAERTAQSKAGVNPDEANRAAFRPMYEKTREPGAFSPFKGDAPQQQEQRALLARIVEGDKGQNFLRGAGNVAGSPLSRAVVGAGAGLLGLSHGGPVGGVGGFGLGSAGSGAVKDMLDRAAANRGADNIAALMRNITNSQPKAIPPDAMRALLAKQFLQRGGAAYGGSLTGPGAQ